MKKKSSSTNTGCTLRVRCPFCESSDIRKNGTSKVKGKRKQRYLCCNPECSQKTFSMKYSYNACNPGVKGCLAIIAENPELFEKSSIRRISRSFGVSTGTIIATLKKRDLTHIND